MSLVSHISTWALTVIVVSTSGPWPLQVDTVVLKTSTKLTVSNFLEFFVVCTKLSLHTFHSEQSHTIPGKAGVFNPHHTCTIKISTYKQRPSVQVMRFLYRRVVTIIIFHWFHFIICQTVVINYFNYQY